jgi:hypothetical protein
MTNPTREAGYPLREETEGVGINQQGCTISRLRFDLGFAEGLKMHAVDFVSSLKPAQAGFYVPAATQ